jgi:hypothetical protein
VTARRIVDRARDRPAANYFDPSVARWRGQAGAGSDQRGIGRPPDRHGAPPKHHSWRLGNQGNDSRSRKRGAYAPSNSFRPRIQAGSARELCDSWVTERWQHLGRLPTESHCCSGTRVDPLHSLQYNPQQISVRHSRPNNKSNAPTKLPHVLTANHAP